VHRAIKHGLAGGNAENFLYSRHAMVALTLQCSERERRADEAEREVDERYRAAWMEQHVGSEFDGTISGVTSFGLFIELDDSKVNGLVHVTQLPNDYYHFDPVRKTLSGERRGRVFRLGDRVRIVVLRPASRIAASTSAWSRRTPGSSRCRRAASRPERRRRSTEAGLAAQGRHVRRGPRRGTMAP
jgi:exoribonuclease R